MYAWFEFMSVDVPDKLIQMIMITVIPLSALINPCMTTFSFGRHSDPKKHQKTNEVTTTIGSAKGK